MDSPPPDPALTSSRTLVARLGDGDDGAAAAVFAQYFQRMVRLAQRRQSPALRARFDAEDVAQSALRTFFGRAHAGQFEVTCADDLRHLLATITLRKLSYQTRRHRSKKRSVTREFAPGTYGHGAAAVAVEVTAPDAASLLVEQLDHLLTKLPEQYQQMLVMRIEGYNVPEIAETLGCCERTVFRALERFEELAREGKLELVPWFFACASGLCAHRAVDLGESFADGGSDDGVGDFVERRFFTVDDDEPRGGAFGEHRQSGGGLHDERRSDGEEEIAFAGQFAGP